MALRSSSSLRTNGFCATASPLIYVRPDGASLKHTAGRRRCRFSNPARPSSIVFTDIQLGGAINGWEVGVRFRKVLPQIQIIYTSGAVQRSPLAVPESLFFQSHTNLGDRGSVSNTREWRGVKSYFLYKAASPSREERPALGHGMGSATS